MRFVVLATQLGVSRDSLAASLNALFDLGLLTRNPGYGHPLRPEYLLTAHGIDVARACHRYLQAPPPNDLLTRKWTAPIMVVCHEGRTRFNEIRSALRITPRALTQALRLLENEGLVERTVDQSYPPAAAYRLSAAGQRVARLARAVGNCLTA